MFSNVRLLLLSLFSLFSLVVLSACGGGGGSSSSDSSTSEATTFSVSGSIQVPTSSLADDDSLQPFISLVTRNNTIDTAQTITNPSIVGGYVSANDGFYSDARFRYFVDNKDIYSVSLLKDQVISLVSFPAKSSGDLVLEPTSLRLLNSDGSEAKVSLSSTANKAISVDSSGDYFIEVTADNGPVLYLLTVSQGLTSAGDPLVVASKTPSMAAEFVPGEVMIKLKESSQSAASFGQRERSSQVMNEVVRDRLQNIAGLTHHSGSAAHGMRMKIDLSVARSNVRVKTALDLSAWPLEYQEKWETLDFIESLKVRDDVEWAEPNYLRKASVNESNNPLYASQWHYPLIDLPAVWNEGYTGGGVTVAVIDTGIASNHADLNDNLVPGYDFISILSLAGDGDGIDSNPEDEGGSFHGSHVAGTIAALNNSLGGIGVAYDAKIMPLRVLGADGSGSDADIAEAILYAVGEPNASNRLPTQSASIINLSLGGPGFSNTLQSAVNAAVAKGTIVIAAAGNENSTAPSYPAAFSNVISVSAVDQSKALAPYSNMGSTISVAAPGGNMQQDVNGDGNVDGVLSTVSASAYAWFQGTSMAAPHVAGVAALMKSVDDNVDYEFFKQKLETGALTDDLGTTGRDDLFGFGLINASKAITSLKKEIPAFLSINPLSLSFDGLDNSTQVIMQMGGSSGAVEITSVTDVDNDTLIDAAWLSVSEVSVGGDNLGTYQVTVDRSGLPENSSYLGTINVSYSIDGNPQTDKQISVLMRVPDPDEVSTVGTLFVGLIERATQEEAEAAITDDDEVVLIEIFLIQQATENRGVYDYSFDDVPPGDYYVFASTNMDQDGVVNDLGEARGDYPVVGDPSLVTVTDDHISNLDFTVGYLNTVVDFSVEDSSKARIIYRIPDDYIETEQSKVSAEIKRYSP